MLPAKCTVFFLSQYEQMTITPVFIRSQAVVDATKPTTERSGGDERRPIRDVPERVKYPDGQQVFVGNLPSGISDFELRDFFRGNCKNSRCQWEITKAGFTLR